MLIYLLRHGETEYNREKRYQGSRDIPLSQRGREQLSQFPVKTDLVYVSPLSRAKESASVLFPGARQVVVDDLREMCFGIFEGRSYIEMEKDPEYIRWVGENCEGRCPGGETHREFSERTCHAFSCLVDQALDEGRDSLFIMAHGGTQMAVMSRYVQPHRDYYSWCAANGGGYVLNADRWQTEQILELVATV